MKSLQLCSDAFSDVESQFHFGWRIVIAERGFTRGDEM
jgi:hypothetical protein